MRYDYAQITPDAEMVGAMIDDFNDSELKQIAGFIEKMKQQEWQQEQQDYMKLIRTVVLPLVHKYARKTQAVLDIEETEQEIQVQLSSRIGFSAGELDWWSKLMFVMAQDIWIDAEDDAVRVHLLYSNKK